MKLIVPVVIFVGVPILYLLLTWLLNPNHRPGWRNADGELRRRDSSGAWLFMGGGGGWGDSGGGGGGGDGYW